MLTVAVLGHVEVRRDGVPVPLPSGKSTEVLIRLALTAGTPVRADRLIDDLWADQPLGVARNTLQVKVSRLRRALGDPALVSGGPAGYTLHVDPAAVDALTDAAVARFSGELLPDAGDWAAPHRARLAERRLRLVAATGDLTAVESLIAEHPLDEPLWLRYVTLLHEAGHRAEALAAYRRVRDLLAAELGVDPGPQLQDLHRRILRPHRVGNLPALTGVLIGRDADLAELQKQPGPLITIAGPAGVGKTRLAIEVARGEAAAWLVRLGGTTAVWPAIGEAFGLAEAGPDTVLHRLGGLDARLILDGCEHLAGELPAIVHRIAAAAPALRILATSQAPLGVDGETVYHLSPLSPAGSVALFAARAGGRPVDPAAVKELCRALDGLPLAIELAAARTRALGVREIIRRLDDRFALLRDPAGGRSLRAAIAWSHDLLSPADQRGLQALAVFAGGASLPAAEHVLAAMGVPAVDVLTRLVDRSLVVAEPDGDEVRYRLLDSVRAYGRERLDEAGQAVAASAAHAAWFAAAANRAAAGLRGPDQARHLATVRAERADIDAALTWLAAHDPVTALRTAIGFGWAWVFLGAGRDRADRIRSLITPDAPAVDRAAAMVFAGWFESTGGDLDRAYADIRAAVRIAGDRVPGRLFLAFVHSQAGRPRDALAELSGAGGPDPGPGTDAADAAGPVPGPGTDDAGARAADRWAAGAAWLLRAWAEIALGEVERARKACGEAVRLLDDDWALGHAEAMLGTLAQAEHRYAAAVTHLTRATAAAERLGFAAAGALHRTNLGRALQLAGDPAAAVAAFRQAITTAHAAGDLRVTALAHTRLARVLRALGHDDEAREHAAAARRWYATAGGGDGALLADHLAAALDDDRAALEQVIARHDPETEALSLDALARLAAEAGRTAEATALLAEADRLAPPHLVTEADRIDKQRVQAR